MKIIWIKCLLWFGILVIFLSLGFIADERGDVMKTILTIGAGWLVLALFAAWAWSKMKAREKRAILRYRKRRLGDRPVECAELCPRFADCYSIHECLRYPDPDAYEEVEP